MKENITIGSTPVYKSTLGNDVKGGLIIIHEVWGLNDHIKKVADRFAHEGYLVVAPDLLSHTGINEKVTAQLQKDLFDPEKRNQVQPQMRQMMAPIQEPEFAVKTVNSLKEIFDTLYKDDLTKQKVAVVGFCFGGTYSYSLAVSEPRLAAAVPFYGHANQSVEELRQIQAPIQAFFGENDEALISNLPELENKMHQAGVDFSYKVYSNCGHAFFNDTNPFAYNQEAASDAWNKTIEFLDINLNR